MDTVKYKRRVRATLVVNMMVPTQRSILVGSEGENECGCLKQREQWLTR